MQAAGRARARRTQSARRTRAARGRSIPPARAPCDSFDGHTPKHCGVPTLTGFVAHVAQRGAVDTVRRNNRGVGEADRPNTISPACRNSNRIHLQLVGSFGVQWENRLESFTHGQRPDQNAELIEVEHRYIVRMLPRARTGVRVRERQLHVLPGVFPTGNATPEPRCLPNWMKPLLHNECSIDEGAVARSRLRGQEKRRLAVVSRLRHGFISNTEVPLRGVRSGSRDGPVAVSLSL